MKKICDFIKIILDFINKSWDFLIMKIWNFFKNNWADVINTLVLLVLMVGLIYSFCRDNEQDKRIEESDYRNRQLTFMPRLIIIGEPKIKSIIEPVAIPRDSLIDTLRFKYRLRVTAKITFKNIGNSLAKIQAIFYSDTLSGEAIYRKTILSENFARKDFGEKVLIEKPFDEYYQNEVMKNDTLSYDFESSILFIDKDEFTLHIIVLYKNASGELYDTYFWGVYKIDPIKMKRPYIKDNNYYPELLEDYSNSIKLSITKKSYYFYSLVEAKRIRENLKKIQIIE